MKSSTPEQSELGKKVFYEAEYNPEKLFPISRKIKRDEISVPSPLPFYGFDLWNHYEVSWLNEKGKPMVAVAEILYYCETPFIIESKSMKLYFNSFNNTTFKDKETVQKAIQRDIQARVQGDVIVKVTLLNELHENYLFVDFQGHCIDELDIPCSAYLVQPDFLTCDNGFVEETLYSNLLKSNCLVTGQPDWGSVQIRYKGNRINREGLLRYIVSFRNHNEFHEQCIERIFMDILNHCKPQELSVYGRYTRRGGLDINPYRSTQKNLPEDLNLRLFRQ